MSLIGETLLGLLAVAMLRGSFLCLVFCFRYLTTLSRVPVHVAFVLLAGVGGLSVVAPEEGRRCGCQRGTTTQLAVPGETQARICHFEVGAGIWTLVYVVVMASYAQMNVWGVCGALGT